MQRRAPFLRSLLARGALALSLLGVLSPAGLRAADGENQPDWSTFELGNSGDLFVRILVRRQATMADRDWLVFEFENRGSKPVVLRNPNYRTRRTCYLLANGKTANHAPWIAVAFLRPRGPTFVSPVRSLNMGGAGRSSSASYRWTSLTSFDLVTFPSTQ